MYISFNELSVNNKFFCNITRSQSIELINNFVKFLKLLKDCNWTDGIITSSIIYSFYVSESYGINDWLRDSSVDKVYKQFFQSFLNTSCSFFDYELLNGEFTVDIGGDCLFGRGCTYAVENKIPILSILSHDYWAKERICGKYTVVLDEGEISTIEETIDNLYNESSITNVERIEINNIYSNISSGQDLWDQRESIFPNLVFCESVKDQLYNEPEKFHIIRIMDRLQYLQDYFARYDGVYNPSDIGIKVHTESETVRSDPELRKHRLFRKPDGSEEFFYDHISFTGKYTGGRIHFLPSNSERKCYIGYIGRHLQTKKY